MRDMNKSILVGRLGKDPIRNELPKGGVIVRFPMATSKRVPKPGENGETGFVEETTWHNISVWGNQAENCHKFLKKGSTVFVEGSTRNSVYQTKDGQKRYWAEVRAEVVSFLGNAVAPAKATEATEAAVLEQVSA